MSDRCIIEEHGSSTYVENDDDSNATVESFSNEESAEACFFCNKICITRNYKKVFCRRIKDKQSCLSTIKKYATEMSDIDMLQKIADENLVARESVCYHGPCHLQYFSKYKKYINRPDTNIWAAKRDIYKLARSRLAEYITCEVIENLRVLSLRHIKNCLVEFLRELHEIEDMDYGSSFFNTGNLKAYLQQFFKSEIKFITLGLKLYVISSKIDIECIDDQEAFITLIQISPSQIDFSSEVFKSIEEFVCRMYSLKSRDVNQGRYELFKKGYNYRSDSESILKKKIVGYDASCLPPTKQELLQQIRRTIYLSSIWCKSFLRTPTEKDPAECGWSLIDNKYQFYWFDGSESPSLGQLYTDNQETDQSEGEDECDETCSSDENETSSETE